MNEFEEIEDLISWNLSFNISVEETLKDINRLDLLYLFIVNDEAPAKKQKTI